ncbi:hypothetical protein MAJHIDBO_01307 [Propionibacterium freudenreichii subsp. shermanii]|nr:hypothetical protein MAJHIDBO_01307 [Propionibacterium freudenreichii subsp. shermanii]SPS09102.1 hypothetical protein MAJHIDBO_01307 [Propionibacterium freudenreichii subsp. shermanii]
MASRGGGAGASSDFWCEIANSLSLAREIASGLPRNARVKLPMERVFTCTTPPCTMAKLTLWSSLASSLICASTAPNSPGSTDLTLTSVASGFSARRRSHSSVLGLWRMIVLTNRLVVSVAGVSKIWSTGPCSIRSPLSSTATRSAIARTTSISWVITTMVTPSFSLTRRSRPSTSWVVSGSRALVDSSASSTDGLVASARAMPTRCFWPPDSSSGCTQAFSVSPTKCSSSVMPAFMSALLHLARRSG